MSAAELSRFDELVSRYLDDTLTNSDAAELVALLAESSWATRFLEMTRLNSEIAGLLAAPVPDAAMVELVRADLGKGLSEGRSANGLRLRVAERTHPGMASQTMVPLAHPKRRRRTPALRALAWAAVFLMFAGLAAIFLINRTRPVESPTVASVQGEVRLAGPGGERVLKAGQVWKGGETLKTVGPNSTVTVMFRDGTRFDFGGNSVVAHQSAKDGHRVELEHGEVQATLKKQPSRHPFTFATSEAEAIVVGTTLRLVAGAHHTRLEVTDGEVRFRRRHDGAEVAVKAGQFAVIAPKVPFVATPFHAAPLHP